MPENVLLVGSKPARPSISVRWHSLLVFICNHVVRFYSQEKHHAGSIPAVIVWPTFKVIPLTCIVAMQGSAFVIMRVKAGLHVL